MYSDSYEPSWRKFTFRNFCEPLLQSFVIFGCKHLSACCRRGNSLCSMNVGILCENCIKIIFATTENTTSRWMLPRLYEIRCIRNCFFTTCQNNRKKNKQNTNTFPDIFPRQEDVTLVIGCGGQSHNAVTLAHSRIDAQHLQPWCICLIDFFYKNIS